MDEDTDAVSAETISTLLSDLEEASKVPARHRGVDIKPTVENLNHLLYETGAIAGDLDRLVELITERNHLASSIKASLVRYLYPTGSVSDEIILRVIGCLGESQRSPSEGVQVLLLKWMIMVYHLIENPDILSQSYSILFNLLDAPGIRPHLCQLLALITRRKHVKPYRIHNLLALVDKSNADPSLAALLRIYKNYYPEIALGHQARGPAAIYKHPNREWRSRLDEIQQNYRATRNHAPDAARNGFAVKKSLVFRGKNRIPEVQTLEAKKDSITLEDVNSAENLVRNLEKIELPTHLVAVLGDPLLQKLLQLLPDDEARLRVSNWVDACVQDVSSGDADQRLLLDMVDTIYEFVRSTKTLPPLFFRLFQELFKIWDGQEKCLLILDILGFVPLMDFKELYQVVLKPMEDAIAASNSSAATSQLLLLRYYKSLLQRWSVILLGADDAASLSIGSITNVVLHVDHLALTVSQTSPTTSTYLAILDFYECAVALFAHPALLPHVDIVIPSPTLVYLLHFDDSLATVSRLYNVLSQYKQAMVTAGGTRGFSKGERASIDVLNGYTTDIVNCVWRNKALSIADKTAKGCGIPQRIVPDLENYLDSIDRTIPLSTIFGLSHSPALSLQSMLYFQKLEEDAMDTSDQEDILVRHAGPVTKASLAALANKGGLRLTLPDFKTGVLQYLDSEGFSGVGELMYSLMKQSLKRPQLQAASGGGESSGRFRRRRPPYKKWPTTDYVLIYGL